MREPSRTAAVLQLLLAATFLLSSAIAHIYGPAAQAAAEAEVARQGFPPEVLAANNVGFDESTVDLIAPLAVAAILTALALLNLRRRRAGRILTWIFQPLLLVIGGLITAGQVFTTQLIQAGFDRAGDPTLKRIDVPAVIDAVDGAFPAFWLPYGVTAKLVLVTAGSLAVIVLLTKQNAARGGSSTARIP